MMNAEMTSYSHCPQCGQQVVCGQFLCGHVPASTMSNVVEIPASAQPGEPMWKRELRPEKVESVVSGLLIPNQAFSKRLASELMQAWARIRELEAKSNA
jgi:hypothetical protein